MNERAAARRGQGADAGAESLAHINEALWTLAAAGLSLCLGFLVGWAVSRLLRREGLAPSWAVVWLGPLAIAVLLTTGGLLTGRAAIVVIGSLVGMLAGQVGMGVVDHIDDLRAGDDRAHAARQRIGPQHLIGRRLAERKITEGRAAELPIGVSSHGRVASIKRGDGSGSHCLIVGSTGAGKSTLLGVLAHEYAAAGHAVVIVEAKTDAGLEEQVRAAAARNGRRFVLISADGPTVWDLLANGGVDETVAKLLACETYSDDYYRVQATRFVRWVVRVIEACGTRLSLPEILRLCEPDRLAAHAAEHGDPQLVAELEQFVSGLSSRERADIGGLRSRLAVLAESEFGRRWLDPGSEAGEVLDLGAAIRGRAVVYFRLDAERLGVVAEKVGAAIAIELGAIASALQGRPAPTFVGIDEYGAIEAQQVERLFARARAAGFSVAIATHTLADLRAAGDAVEDRLKATVDSVLCLRCGPDDADSIARLGGQVGTWHSTQRTAGPFGLAQEAGTRSRGYRLRMHPSVLLHLGWGQCAVMRLDRSDRDRAALCSVIPSWRRRPTRKETR